MKNIDELEQYNEPDISDLECRLPEFFPSLHLWGHSFSPARLHQEYPNFEGISEQNEPWEPNVAGPYRFHPHHWPYGCAIIRPPVTVSSTQRLFWMVRKVLSGYTKKVRKDFGICDQTMYLTAHFPFGQQCSTVLPPIFLRALKDISLVITYIRPEERPDSFSA